MPDIEAVAGHDRRRCRGLPKPRPTRCRSQLRWRGPDLRQELQSEIKARVANFRANQERFSREREAYCSATMAKVHAAIKDGRATAAAGQVKLPRPRLARSVPADLLQHRQQMGQESLRVLANRKWPRPFMMVPSQPGMLFATASVSSGVQE